MGFTVGMVKPDAVSDLGELLDLITRSSFTVDEVRTMQLTDAEAREFYVEHAGKPWLDDHIEHVTCGEVVFLVLTSELLSLRETVRAFRELLGPSDPREGPSETIRHRFGTDLPRNAMHGSSDVDAAIRELTLLRRFCAARGDRAFRTFDLSRWIR